LFLILAPALAPAQPAGELQGILERLGRLEQENRALTEEISALRRELAALQAAPAGERVEIHERRLEEHQQTKVEASQRLPIRVTGMALFNAFLNSKGAGGADNPTTAPAARGPASGGATMRQTVVGIEYDGPQTLWDGKVRGSLFGDFFAGSNQPLNHLLRIRVASLEVNWKTRSVMVGQEKPLISIREPNSLSQVGVSPLTNAGNLWLWMPQARFEQRFAFDAQSGLRAQFALFRTNEASANVPAAFASTLEPVRPALQGRFELFRDWEGGRLALAPGFHTSSTHVAGASVPSTLASFDWLVRPVSKFEFTGMFFTGENVANMGSVRQGFTILGPGEVIPVRSKGGWAQFTFLPTPRWTFNIYGGQIDDRNQDLRFGGIAKNVSYAGNAMYRLGSNVIVSLEAAKVRTTYLDSGNRENNHYDLAVAYLF
jgi:hypothetical protein